MSCFTIPENATDPLDIMNAVMTFDYPPPPDPRWERRIAALCEALAVKNEIICKLPKTADGVPVVPGMDVWIMERLPIKMRVTVIQTVRLHCPGEDPPPWDWYAKFVGLTPRGHP